MDDMRGVGIVILNYNTAADTLACVESIESCHIFRDKIVLVDNHSAKESIEPLKKLGTRSETVILEAKKNRGFAAGMNIGIRYLRSLGIDTVLCLNADTRITQPDFMEKMLAEAEDGAAVVGVNRIIGDGIDRAGGIKEDNSPEFLAFHIWEALCRRWYIYWPLQYREKKTSLRMHGCAFMLGPRWFARYPALWEGTFLYREENILLTLCEKAGLRLALADTEIWHKQGAASTQDFANFSRVKRKYEMASSLQQLMVSLLPIWAVRAWMGSVGK